MSKLLPFAVSFVQEEKHCHFNFRINAVFENTNLFPDTLSILKRELPSILNSQCINAARLPFAEEVTHTEIGHIYEHILLEYLALEKIHDGNPKYEYEGKTSWNTAAEGAGIYHITIDVPASETDYLNNALKNTNRLINKILESATLQPPSLI